MLQLFSLGEATHAIGKGLGKFLMFSEDDVR